MKNIVHYKFIILLFILFGCSIPKPNLWNVPKDYPKSDLITVRRFNAGIRAIDGVAITLNRDDVALLPGRHSINVQPEMWVSTFPMGKHLEQIKAINFEAKSGEVIYLCLGLRESSEWSPYAVIVQPGENPTQRLLFAMRKNGSCVSSNKSLPVFWTDP
ncbi:hypothetical protein CH378_18065 [Leptospira kmetyi]|uniref:Lipoprotein n=2 Tax=Leptospira kmetyi TaxID=408139 RepID=A0ABX4N4Q8_9LEPT|nr:hypothetical protein CH378_18065 [Leptospira kmetyi]